MATGSRDGLLRIVESATGHVEREVQHGNFVLSVAWSPSGAHVATGSHGGLLRIVESATGRVEHEVQHGAAVESVAWSP